MKYSNEEVEYDVGFDNADGTDAAGHMSSYNTVEAATAYAKQFMLDNPEWVKATILRRSLSEVAYITRKPFVFTTKAV